MNHKAEREKIYKAIDQYLRAMKSQNKNPSIVTVSKAQMVSLESQLGFKEHYRGIRIVSQKN